jgi:coatomer subunit beta'
VGFGVEGIFGGRLLGVKSKDFITFYDWDTQVHVRRIDVSPAPKNVYWSDAGDKVVLGLEDNYYLLHLDGDAVANYVSEKEGLQENQAQEEDDDDDGCEDAFEF